MTAVHTPVGVQLLEQAEVWQAWDDEQDRLVDLPLDTLSALQRSRLLAWARANAPALQRLTMLDLARQQITDAGDVETIRARARALTDADPGVWVERLPLVRALAASLTPPRSRVRRMCGWYRR